jgi:hypothetical protein
MPISNDAAAHVATQAAPAEKPVAKESVRVAVENQASVVEKTAEPSRPPPPPTLSADTRTAVLEAPKAEPKVSQASVQEAYSKAENKSQVEVEQAKVDRTS